MVSRYTFGTRFVPAVILVTLMCCCGVQISSAQGITLAFSTTASAGTDGFNNGVFVLPASSAVPVAIGLFDAQTGLPATATGDIHLAVDIRDAAGMPHPLLSVYGTPRAILQAGTGSVSSTFGLRWKGAFSTTATVRVRDLDNVLADIEVAVVFDPMLIGDVHVVAQIVEDRNFNGVYDSADRQCSDVQMKVCQIEGMRLAASSDGTYRIDLPSYTRGFPLQILPVDCPQWRSAATGGREGVIVEGYGTYVCTYLVQRVQTPWIWSGVVHRPSGSIVCERRDSSLLVRSLTDEASSLAMELQAADWRMTSMITPSATTVGTLSFAFYEGLCQEGQKTGELSVHCANGREVVTPLFSTPYSLLVYRNGAVVYSHYSRVGPAVSLVRTVRRWFARNGSLGVEEIQGAKVQIIGGPVLQADSVVFRPQAAPTSTLITRIVCTGKGIDTVEIFDHEIGAWGLYHRATGTMMPVQTEAQQLNLVAPQYQGDVRIAMPGNNIAGFALEWGEPVSSGVAPQVEISAQGGRDALMRELGALVFKKNPTTIGIHALPQPEFEGAVQVQVLLGEEYIADAIAIDGMAATCALWPYRTGISVHNDIHYIVQWREPVIVQLADGRAVECDKLRLVYPATAPSAQVLSAINLRLLQGDYIPVYDETCDTVIPALPLTAKITLTGNVYDDTNVSGTMNTGEPGRPGRVVVFKGDPMAGWQIEYDTTDASGFFSKEFDPTVQGWAPEKVTIVAASGWIRTSADYDLLSSNQCNMSLTGLDFGEIPADKVNPGFYDRYSGRHDNFLVDEDELADPAMALEALVEGCGYTPTDQYDVLFRNRFFIHTFEGIRPDGCALTGAQLVLRLRACAEDAYNDRIILQACGRRFWHSDISHQTAEGVWYEGRTTDIVLNLNNLPPGGSEVYDAVQLLQAGHLDLVIDDDTQIDYALLSVEFACKAEDAGIIRTDVTDEPALGIGALQVFPNPSRGMGTVAFTLAQRETVTVVVYDVLNREVARLLSGASLGAGRQAVSFILPSLARGRYTLAIHTGSGTRTQSLWIEP